MSATSDVLDRLAALDEGTRSTVVAAFGCNPFATELGDDEVARLAATIAAVVAGTQAAVKAEAEADYPPEQELPPLLPPDVAPLRARVRDLDDTIRGYLLQRWQTAGYPGLANPDGTDAALDRATYHSIEHLVAEHEPPAAEGVHGDLVARYLEMPPGPRWEVKGRAEAQGLGNFRNPLGFTAGRASVLADIIETVTAEAESVIAAAIGPVAEPLGRLVAEPKADAEALALTPPDGKVADVLAWVGADLQRAAAALEAERRRPKPRASLVDKLAPLVVPPTTGEGVTAVPAPPAVTPAAPGEVPGQLDLVEAAQAAPEPDDDPPRPLAPPLEKALRAVVEKRQPRLESSLFRETPTSEWGPLTFAAYFRQLGSELTKAADILETFAQQSLAERKAS